MAGTPLEALGALAESLGAEASEADLWSARCQSSLARSRTPWRRIR